MVVTPKHRFWVALALFADAKLDGGKHARLEHVCEFNAFPDNVRYAKSSVYNVGLCRVMCVYIEFTAQMRVSGLRSWFSDEPIVWIPCIGPRARNGNIPLNFIADALDVDFMDLEDSWEFGTWVPSRTKSINMIQYDKNTILYPLGRDSYDIIRAWKFYYVKTKRYFKGEPTFSEELDILIQSIRL